ncbi:bifunctional diaminohydroxyphosphoribosylaminopyrimidine deaminase/5-amino-6-(5-phosphoribosylamino)uracil reductase RibD [uncultured Kriegella sp.]|uniref:bifunctional diaminohydroxyphosphoribosylaminopyrimidine deaminase/5-amino-6-(5-phosphoribosylamino)uracil reductase RibD n=1 Tax=uncultured Kriegella sp. TaxID=1798910 RepID=UPI0030DB23A3
MNIHEKYISRCISLGKNGQPAAYPNPSVGCVLVYGDMIIGEGYTSAYGGAHAEVNAIASVKNKALLKDSTLYSTLEPCSHFGKTPPCADLIVKNNIPNVVIGILDPHKKVAGRGLKRLRDAGCEVIEGVLAKECREHHNRFLTFHEKKRPYILLKWAQSLDGFIAPAKEKRNKEPEPFWITSQPSRQRVHQWRSEEQAILVGTTTVLEDNPKLDVRHWSGKNPIRVVLDKDLKIKGNYHVLDGTIPTIIFTTQTDDSKYIEGIEYSIIDFSANIPQQINSQLHKRNVLSILVEGGKRTIETFVEANLWDEARIFTGNTVFKKGITAPKLSGKLVTQEYSYTDTLNTFIND